MDPERCGALARYFEEEMGGDLVASLYQVFANEKPASIHRRASANPSRRVRGVFRIVRISNLSLFAALPLLFEGLSPGSKFAVAASGCK
jgi:hypothetical protein